MIFFGESLQDFMCGVICDHCCNYGEFYVTDGTSHALKLVQAIVQLTGRVFTCNTLKLFFARSQQKIIKEQELDVLSNFGCLEKRFVPTVLLDKFLHILIYFGILAEIP
jgi:superfamily II DNA helicase RecQ